MPGPRMREILYPVRGVFLVASSLPAPAPQSRYPCHRAIARVQGSHSCLFRHLKQIGKLENDKFSKAIKCLKRK